MERSAGASFGGRDGGFGGGSGWQFMKTRGFLTRGFAISEFRALKKPIEERFCRTAKVMQNLGSQAQLFIGRN